MFQVRWNESATRAFLQAASLAESATHRKLLSAIDDIEQVLRDDPESAGESRDRGARIIVDRLLTVTFEVDEKSQIVAITKDTVHRPRQLSAVNWG